MSSISSWVLSIAGICVLSVLIDLFLPEGKINSYIKSIFNFAIVLVVITPLPSLIKSDFDSSSLFTNSNIVLQEDYIYQLNRDKLTMLEKNIEDKLKNNGFLNVDISISADIFTTKMTIDAIFVDLSNLVIQQNNQHIDIKNEIINIINSYVELKKEAIIFSG